MTKTLESLSWELVKAQSRMLDKWAEGDDKVKNDLWKALRKSGSELRELLERVSPPQTGDAEEVLSKHTGETGIYLTKGMVRGSDALEAMEEYANIKTAVYRNMVYRLAEEMRRSEWDSPVYEEAKQLLNK